MSSSFEFSKISAHVFRDKEYTSFAYGLVAVFLMTVLLATGLSVKKDFDNQMSINFKEAKDTALIYQEQLTQIFQLVENVARSLNVTTAKPFEKTGNEELEMVLQRAQFSLPAIRSMSLMTDDFKIFASSNKDNLGLKINASLFDISLTMPREDKLFLISRPWFGRDLSDGRPSTTVKSVGVDDPYFIPVIFRFNGADEKHRNHWIFITLNPDYLYGLLAKYGSFEHHDFELTRSDGLVLLSEKMSLPGDLSSKFLELKKIKSIKDETFYLDEMVSYKYSDKFKFYIFIKKNKDDLTKFWIQSRLNFLIWMLIAVFSGVLASLILLSKLKSDRLKHRNQKMVVHKLLQALEQSPSGVLITDLNGVVEYCNSNYCSMLNASYDSIAGTFAVMFSTDMSSPFMIEQIKNKLMNGEIWSSEFVHPGNDSHGLIEVQVIWAPLFDKNNVISNFICIEHDITQLKNMQLELSNSRDQAEASTRAKSEFLANISHEIRTPLSGVIGMTHLALDEKMPDKVREYISNAKSSAASLFSILNDILDFSKMEAGKLQLDRSRFDFYTWIENLIIPHNILAKQKGLHFEYTVASDVPKWIVSDSLRLGQILNNILSNAVKFTSNGAVKLAISVHSKSTGEKNLSGNFNLKFHIKDTGCGISRDEIKKLFQPFSQANYSTSRLYGGTGLGLVICKKLCTAFNGDISLTSEPNVGTEFLVIIPVQSVDVKDDATQKVLIDSSDLIDQVDTQSLQDKKVLLVEDHPFNRQMMMVLLGKIGLSVDFALNGRDAIIALNARPNYYDIVLMDIQMPIMDGITATREIRINHIFDDLPIIAITANALSDEKDACIQAGMQAYLVKPVNPSALHDVLLVWSGRGRNLVGKIINR